MKGHLNSSSSKESQKDLMYRILKIIISTSRISQVTKHLLLKEYVRPILSLQQRLRWL